MSYVVETKRHTGGKPPLEEGLRATPLVFKAPSTLIDELDAAVGELGTTRSALIRQALEDYLRRTAGKSSAA